MRIRPLSTALAVLACILGSSTAFAGETPDPKKAPPPNAKAAATAPMSFYLAHGDVDACGRNCDEWIAAEGKIDASTAYRLRQLLAKLKGRRPPIYFHSPGGTITGSLELGRLIREKNMQVSVGHTLAVGCDRDKPADNSCDKQKRSGEAIEATFDPTAAMCNSGCVYALAGGVVRIVPPWVKLGIHDAGFEAKTMIPQGAMIAAALRVTHSHIRGFLREMGIDDALFTATLAVPNDKVRSLQRDDVIRFGIDRREFGETVWQFVDKPRPAIRKRFFVRADGEQAAYLDGLVNVDCGIGFGMRLVFARQHLASESWPPANSSPTTNFNVNGKQIALRQVANANFYVRSGEVATNAFDIVGDDATIKLPGAELGRTEGAAGDVILNMDGFSPAHAKLKTACAEQPRNAQSVPVQLLRAKPVTASPDNAAKPAGGESPGAPPILSGEP